ncbi:uncharacterized protein ACHE_80361A [Aspergillus chevalieri]|uniref:Uncharacterized protein n=1 Tax=Aspergillus chevalieri TaxID=182096 RepID=A0A7R7VXC7_ASPCH|nr:uncharacterized protein ACHE_80361A [Aspergillus chevalieri]BCR92461.1 hypothetical protein ACHE_80361A [Aspergillus chevalieri]
MAIVSSGRKQKVDKSEARRKLRESRNYDPLAHRKEDSQRSRGRASMETKELYKETVKLYEEFLTSEGVIPAEFRITENFPVPKIEELKSFIRWYIASTEGSIDDSPTMRTVLTFAQQFVPGFYLVTGNQIPP